MSDIGDSLYELVDGDWDGNGQPDLVIVYPVAKITERFVYVKERHYDRTCRIDRAKLEAEGFVYVPRFYARLYVRPAVDWPLAVVSVDRQRAIT